MDALSSPRSQLNLQYTQQNSLPGSGINLHVKIELDEIRRCQDEFQANEKNTYTELLNKFEPIQRSKIADQFRNIESLTKFYTFLLARKVPLDIPMGVTVRIYLGDFPDPNAKKTSDELRAPESIKAASAEWNNALTTWSVKDLKIALKINPNLINMPDQYGMTALMQAIYRKDAAMMFILLGLGADTELQLQSNRYPGTTLQIGRLSLEKSVNEGRFTESLITEIAHSPSLLFAGSNTLTMAIQCKASPEVIEILCKYGKSKNANFLNEQDGQGRTPLTLAVAEGNAEIVTTLILAGAMIDQADHQGKTPLMVATINKNIGLIKTCISNHANPLLQNKEYKNAFSFACRFGTHEEINALLKSTEIQKQKNFNEEMGHGFYVVVSEEIKSGNIKEIERLLAICEPYISPTWKSVLLLTAESLNNQAIKNVLEKSLKINTHSSSDDTAAGNHAVSSKFALKTMLDNAISNGYTSSMSRFELSKLLSEAAAYGNLENVKKIVEQGAWILFVDSDGRTPLDIATEHANLAVAKYLTEKQFTYSYNHDLFWEDLNKVAIMDGDVVQLDRQLQLITDKNFGFLLNQNYQILKLYGLHYCKQAYLRTFDYALSTQNTEIIDVLFSSPLFEQSQLSEFIADLIIHNSHSAMIPLVLSYPCFSYNTALDRALSQPSSLLVSFLQGSIALLPNLDRDILKNKIKILKKELSGLKKDDHYAEKKRAIEILEYYSKMLKQAQKDPDFAIPQYNFSSRKN